MKKSYIYDMKYVYDCHLHLLPLNHICLSAYLDYSFQNTMSETYAQLTAHDYVMSGILHKQGDVQGLVAVVEHSIKDQIALYEGDLRGDFLHPSCDEKGEKNEKNSLKPILDEKGIHICSTDYDKLVLCAQIMDFDLKSSENAYYPSPKHDIVKHANEILDGINQFKNENPNSKVEVLPFFGINPLNYEEDYIAQVLENCFATEKEKPEKFHLSEKFHLNTKSSAKTKFAGIKLYPPMGFDPFPSDKTLMAKNEILFDFCEKNAIPIVTHCDDQGFRMVPLNYSFEYTSPERWLKVLEKHPNLYLDFAHFGTQYYHGMIEKLKHHELSWRDMILFAMKEYPHVYSDLSFGGVDTDMWEEVTSVVQKARDEEKEIYSKRLLYGTDWPLSLSKIQSVLAYWTGFENGFSSAATTELADRILSKNPETFLHQEI